MIIVNAGYDEGTALYFTFTVQAGDVQTTGTLAAREAVVITPTTVPYDVTLNYTNTYTMTLGSPDVVIVGYDSGPTVSDLPPAPT